MSLEKIIAIAGKPGLFKIVSQTKGGLIAESLIEKKRMPINAMHNVSVLNDIAIYTHEDEMPLRSVLKNMAKKENNKESISHKEPNDKLIAFFSEVLPNYDEERVYASNIKKVIQWYNILVHSKFDFSSIKEEEDNKEKEA